MRRVASARTARAVMAAIAVVGAAAGLAACKGAQLVPFEAQAAPAATLDAIEGDWAPQGASVVRELSIERDDGAWEVEVEYVDSTGAEVEREFPARLLGIGGRTILEVEIARGKTGGSASEQAAAYLYSDVTVGGDVMRTKRLDAEWLRAYTQTHPALKIAAIAPWSSERALGVGRAEGLSAMLQAAAADASAWGEASVWVNAQAKEEAERGGTSRESKE